MSSPYTQPTLVNYNATPPVDDGSAVATNALRWSNHINKIGDPLKNFAQAIDSNLLTAFTKVFGSTISTKIADYTVVAGDQGKVLEFTAAATLTLIAAATAGANFPLLIVNNSAGLVIVDGDSSETINGSTTITLRPNDSILITCDGSKWVGAVVTATDQLSARKAADTSRDISDGVTPILDPDLQFTLEENVGYAFDAVIVAFTASAVPNIHFNWQSDYSGTLIESLKLETIEVGAGFNAVQGIGTPFNSTPKVTLNGISDFILHFSGHFHNTKSALFGFRWAQDSLNATPTTVKAGSYIRMTRL